MFVLIATMTYGAALLAAERNRGLLRRLASSPLTSGELVLGKALGRALLATVQIAVFVLAGLILFRIDWGSSPAGLAAVLAAYAACAAALSLLSGTLFATPEAAAGAGTVSTLVMSALGGCWWPAEVAPAWMRVAGHAFPTAWAMDGLHQVISWGGGLRDVMIPCVVLLTYALSAGTLAAHRLGRESS
jgi:ABC-type multidrug transport system permease subunit